MLVFGRKPGEEIVIDGGRIVVRYIENTGGGTIRIGVTAPRDVRVDRREIHDRRKWGGKPTHGAHRHGS